MKWAIVPHSINIFIPSQYNDRQQNTMLLGARKMPVAFPYYMFVGDALMPVCSCVCVCSCMALAILLLKRHTNTINMYTYSQKTVMQSEQNENIGA